MSTRSKVSQVEETFIKVLMVSTEANQLRVLDKQNYTRYAFKMFCLFKYLDLC